MEQIKINNLTFAYDSDSDFSLRNISLQVQRGEVLLITGVSGCGKTTLLRHLKREYMPQGVRSSDTEIRMNGTPIEDMDERELARLVGFVGQRVDEKQVTDKVWHELAFGLENLGYSQSVMQRKVAEMTAFFGLEGIYHEKFCNLSGGQKQLVNLASVMAMEPEVLVLDEPTSQLDPVAATEFFHMIEKINRELGTTIIMTEHRLEEVFSMSQRVCVMEQGRLLMVNTPQKVACALFEKKHELFHSLPTPAKLYLMMEKTMEEVPFTVNEGRNWLEKYMVSHPVKTDVNENMSRMTNATVAVNMDEAWFRYEKNGKDILKACSLKVEQGKITAILGGNGAGKSTLLHVIAGHFTPYLGKVKNVVGSIGMLPQNPQAMFAKKTVEEELFESLGAKFGKSDWLMGKDREKEEMDKRRVQEMIDFFDLEPVIRQHPFDLSGGQMQKLALAKLLLEDKDVLLLDEPSKGMDYDFKDELGQCLLDLAMQGKTILMVSHDVEFCAKYADVCGLFFDGTVVSMADSKSFFRQNTFYTTVVTRMCRGHLPVAVVMEDVLQLFGVERDASVPCNQDDRDNAGEVGSKQIVKNAVVFNSSSKEHPVVATGEHKIAWLITLIMVLVVMPFTIYVGHVVLLQRKYYFISLMLVLEAVACFLLGFEKRKPKVREIMIIAVMSAIVVVGRAAFYMVPSVKPMAALVILTGVGLGAEAGFLVGSMSMLVSDIFFGQGPWTPWQMFAMGMLGFLAGIIFRRKTSVNWKQKLPICIFGLCSVVLVYGGIMNPASVLMYQEYVELEMILSAYAMGLPFDLIHGIATFVFLWIGSRPLLEKLQRVREKTNF